MQNLIDLIPIKHRSLLTWYIADMYNYAEAFKVNKKECDARWYYGSKNHIQGYVQCLAHMQEISAETQNAILDGLSEAANIYYEGLK